MKLADFQSIEPTEADGLLEQVRAFNDNQTAYPRDKTVHAVFSERAAQAPDAIAVAHEKENHTYRQVDERSNRIAHLLVVLGLSSEAFAAIMVEDTFNLVTALLGTLKAGGVSREVMDAYGESIKAKLSPLINRQTRILEIGCASGLSMFRLAPLAGTYCGTDLSPRILQWTEQERRKRRLEGIQLRALPAHQIDQLEESSFDIVIINSVLQCFSGHNYLRTVLRKALSLMKDQGWIFLGNIFDQDLKDDFLLSLIEYKKSHDRSGNRTKIDYS
jgi:2-polyprenyl-3-methyl-5-hydroxy-6-metoxy-1,4-benzoquinol methylase